MQTNPKKFAVLGDPISHSKSPQIHQAFAQEANLEISYEKFQTTSASLEKTLQHLQENHYTGVNLTSPLKETALLYVDELTERARQANVINTLTFLENGKRRGDNTDGIGLQNDFEHRQLSIKNKKILILGAGGATRGILGHLFACQPSSLFIFNRTPEKVASLAEKFSQPIQLASAITIKEETFDLCINALPEISDLSAVDTAIYYDLKYAVQRPTFSANTLYFNGLGMLIEQAAEAFALWHAYKPSTKSLRNTLLTLSP